MARGGYYVGAKGLEGFEAELKATAGGLADMRAAHRRIAEHVSHDVFRRAPMGHRSPKDSRSHLWPGSLKASIRSGASYKSSWVESAWKGPLVLQEFGGKSIWKRGIQAGFHRTRKRSQTGYFTASSAHARAHLVYTKSRRPRGYFLWNAAFRQRRFIGTALAEGIAEVAAKHGINVTVAQGGGLQGNLEARTFR